MTSPIEHLSSLVVGAVEAVAPNEINVLLELDAPHATALNSGVPTPFPRLNGYVLIPNEAGATVGYVAWVGIERSPYPKRSGLKDFGLIDLPFPLRKMKVVPVGTLINKRESGGGQPMFELTRGVSAFPSVGDQVLLPADDQLRAIVSGSTKDRRVWIGTAPMSAGAEIRVDPDKLFGRHLAVLGNTGSGKSCSVAGLIRWSLDAAKPVAAGNAPANARFIILDPNGEYANSFADLGSHVRIFAPGDPVNPLLLPAWMWNSHEWTAITNAQPGTQRPLLMQALRALRAGRTLREPTHTRVTRVLKLYKARLLAMIVEGSYSTWGGRQDLGRMLVNISEVMRDFANRDLDEQQQESIGSLAQAAQDIATQHSFPYKDDIAFNEVNVLHLERMVALADDALSKLPTISEELLSSEDAPVPFDIRQLADTVDDMSADGPGNANIANLVAFLTLRLRSLLGVPQLSQVIAPNEPITLSDWLGTYVGESGATNGQVAVLDLSLVPSDTLHIVVAVLARLVFEALQRYRKRHVDGKALPTVLVLEEAHAFVKRGSEEEGGPVSPARLCREAFETIAREGRKFGLGLVLSSQRPSELSPTVLAQCNTFLLHRIVNDADQQLVARLVPDNVGSLLRELPSLPSRQAILLGWATPIPVLVEMRELAETHRPRSDDPDFWDVWTRTVAREVDWVAIARAWSGETDEPSEAQEPPNPWD